MESVTQVEGAYEKTTFNLFSYAPEGIEPAVCCHFGFTFEYIRDLQNNVTLQHLHDEVEVLSAPALEGAEIIVEKLREYLLFFGTAFL